LWRGRWIVLTTAIVGAALGMFVAHLQVRQYRSAVMLKIEPPPPMFMSVNEAFSGGSYWQNSDYYNTEFRIMRSKSVGERALKILKLTDQPPFKDSTDPGSLLMSHVSIEPVTESRLVNIVVTHTDPKEAALWANTIGQVYVEQSLANRVEAAGKTYEWLMERMAATKDTMRQTQEKLFKGLQTQDLFVPEGSVSAVSTSITKLNEDFMKAYSRRIELETQLKYIDDLRAQKRSIDSLPQITADPVIVTLNSELASLDLQLSQLKEQFREGHPDVQRVQSKIAYAQKAKQDRAAQIVTGMRDELNQVVRRETELRAAGEEQKSLAQAQSRKATELEAYRKEAKAAESLYDVLLQKVNETDISASIKTNVALVVERADPPAEPFYPQKGKSAGTGIVLGLLSGIGLVFARDFLSHTIKDPDEVERYLHVDLLAAVPRYDEASVHFVTEAYQNLRTALVFARKEETGQVVLVTGSAPQEGKTTTLLNIAKLLASGGEKTIVLDFDLRRSQIHTRLGLSREPGITDLFTKHDDLDTLIRPTRVPNLFALTSGPLPPNPPAILTRRNFPDFLDHLRRHFDWVLMDSPPLASVTDALLLARYADLVVAVVQFDKIDKRVIKRSINSIKRVTPNLLGVVLNAVDIKSKGYYYYYYQHQTDGAAEVPKTDAPADAPASK
jgi:succinoglycan biosynthesis transport protein ExoP